MSGPSNGASFANGTFTGSNVSWINVGNAAVSDDVYSSFGDIPTGTWGNHTDYLAASNFGFHVPIGADIKGIIVSVERSDPNGKTGDYAIQLMKAGVLVVANRSTGALYPATDAYQNFGNATDLWGTAWTATDINDPGFGVSVAAQRVFTGGTTAGQIDNIQISVYYSFTTLPVHLTDFSVRKTGNTARLDWTTADESDMNRYETERSADGYNFTAFASIPSQGTAAQHDYSLIDQNPLHGLSYYRVKMIGNSGDISYSKIIPFQYSTGNTISLYPNPLKKGDDLFISNPNQELLTIRFYNTSGQMNGSVSTISSKVALPSGSLSQGILFYKVMDGNNSLRGSGLLLIN